MRRAFVQGGQVFRGIWKAQITRGFARQLRPASKKLDLDKLLINDRAVIYRQEINAERDFFYQEMVDLPTEERLLAFFKEKEDQFDGLGIKLLLQELLKRSTEGKIPKRKILANMLHSEELMKYKNVVEILDQKSEKYLDKLDISYFNELLEMISKYGLTSENFTVIVIKRLLVRGELGASQWGFELLLRCVKQDSAAYPILLELLEESLTAKRVEVKDPVVALSLLDSVLTFRSQNMKLVRQLEHYFMEATNRQPTADLARHLLAVYAAGSFRSPNLDVLDKVSAVLVPEIPQKDIPYLRLLLKDLATIGGEDFTLLAALSRRLFDLLADKVVGLHQARENGPQEHESDDEDKNSASDMEDEESLEAISARLFSTRLIDSAGDPNLGSRANKPSEETKANELLSKEDVELLPEMLFHLFKLNVASHYISTSKMSSTSWQLFRHCKTCLCWVPRTSSTLRSVTRNTVLTSRLISRRTRGSTTSEQPRESCSFDS
jgi:hypothetical protein